MAYRQWPLRINSSPWVLSDVALHLYSYGFDLLIWPFIAWLGTFCYALRYHVARPSGPARVYTLAYFNMISVLSCRSALWPCPCVICLFSFVWFRVNMWLGPMGLCEGYMLASLIWFRAITWLRPMALWPYVIGMALRWVTGHCIL